MALYNTSVLFVCIDFSDHRKLVIAMFFIYYLISSMYFETLRAEYNFDAVFLPLYVYYMGTFYYIKL